MSQTGIVTHYNIRTMIDDLSRESYAISTPRMNLIVKREVQLLAARSILPIVSPTSIALTAGTYDYTITGTPQTIRQLILNSDGTELDRISLEEMNNLYKQDTNVAAGRATPRVYALYEINTQVCKVRLGPTPVANDSLDIYYEIAPAAAETALIDGTSAGVYGSANDVPFPPLLLGALERMCAAHCVSVMDEADRARRKINPQAIGLWRDEADDMVRQSNWRARFNGRSQSHVMRRAG